MQWQIDKPLAVFDLEATGTNPRVDRIVEMAVVIIFPEGRREVHAFRINPGVPIPPEASAIHGILDADVAREPTFKERAPKILELLDGCDLGGYNCIRFDIPMLIEEFVRAGLTFPVAGRRVVDAQRIFHKREPRDLVAALAFYCNDTHLDAHGAEADALATVRVLEGELARYPDLPRTVDELDRYCDSRDPTWADREGRLRIVDGAVTLNFGKKKGETLRHIAETDPGFLKWMLKAEFPTDTKDIVRKVLNDKSADPLGKALGEKLPAVPLPPPKAPSAQTETQGKLL